MSRRWQEFERGVVAARCGADAVGQPREALLALVAKLRQVEGAAYATKLTGFDAVGQRVTVALAERSGLEVFRYKGQRQGTVMLRGPETFVEEFFLPLADRIHLVMREQMDAWVCETIDSTIRDFMPKPPKQLELGSG